MMREFENFDKEHFGKPAAVLEQNPELLSLRFQVQVKSYV